MKEEQLFLPKVSIVIPVYNGSNYLRDAIESAIDQEYANLEILVINDGSHDDGITEKIALSYGEKIRYYRKDNGGVATALNLGIQKMTGEYFSWLSHDDIYKPNKISAEIEALSKVKDKTRVVCCGYDVVDADRNFLYQIDPAKEYGMEKLERPLFPVFHCCINGCGLLIHKSHFERVGIFNETLPTTQDYDLWFRILRGRKMLFIEGSYFYSRSHDAQDSRKLYGQHIEECNDLWIRLFQTLSTEEKCQMGNSELNFYREELERFKQTDYYAAKLFLERCVIESILASEKLSADNAEQIKAIFFNNESELKNTIKLLKETTIEQLEFKNRYETISNSTFWKITKPLRMVMDRLKTLKF